MPWTNRLKNLFRDTKLENEIDEELRFHLEARRQDNLRAGLTSDAARQDAVHRFGSRTLAAEGAREANLLVWLDTIRQDLRYAFRTLRKNRGFTAVAVVSLALGIGANTAIFSLIDTLMIKGLPVRHPEEQVMLAIPGSGPKARPGTSFSYPMYEEIRDGNSSFAGITATFGAHGKSTVTVDGQQDRATLSWVSATYFSVLGVNAILGRTFTVEEDRGLGNHPVAVIGHGYWQRRFGEDARVLGKTIVRDKKVFTIIGVAPPEFFGTEVGESVDVWLPLTMQNPVFLSRAFESATLIARLKPGLPESAALAGVNVLFSQLRRHEDERIRQSDTQHRMTPEQHQKFLTQRLAFLPANKGLSGLREQFSRPLVVLMAVVGLVLLIACLNVANLLLARATARQREIAVRLSMGAGRGRIIRQLLTESALVAAAGGALGVGVAYWASQGLIRMVRSGTDPIGVHFELNAEVLGFTIAISLLTGLLFGLAPALSATRLNLTPMLKDDGRGPGWGTGRPRWRVPLRKALVGIQIALSLMLMAGAGLFVRTLQNLLNQDAGFDRSSVLLANVAARAGAPKGPLLLNEFREILRNAGTMPGVRSASLSTYRLFGGMSWTDPPYIDGFPSSAECHLMGVSPSFFETMGIRLSAGRGFTDRDDDRGPAVAVVNESMARHFFGDVSPLGKHFGWTPRGPRQIEIVGVVKDAKWGDLRAASPPFIYFPFFQWQASPYDNPKNYPGSDAYLQLRTSIEPAGLMTALRQAVAGRNGFRTGEMVTQAALVEQSVATERLLARLSGFFGVLALILACIGLYGLMSYTVARRTNEIGVRIALGAARLDVIGLVFRETLLLVIAGIAIGVPATLVCTRFIGSFLFGLSPTDAVTIGSAGMVLLAIAGAAAYVPARRASRTDPMVALRYE